MLDEADITSGMEQSFSQPITISTPGYNGPGKLPAGTGLLSQGVPVLQITIVHAGNSHTISKGDYDNSLEALLTHTTIRDQAIKLVQFSSYIVMGKLTYSLMRYFL